MKHLALILPLLALVVAGCRKNTLTSDAVPACIMSSHQDSDGRLTLTIGCDSANAKGRAFLGSTEAANNKGKRVASVNIQFYKSGHIPGPGGEQLAVDENAMAEYSVGIEQLNAAINGLPEQFRPDDRILHVFINQTEVGQWDLELPAPRPDPGEGSGEAEPSPSVGAPDPATQPAP